MSKNKNIISEFWEYVESKDDKLSKQVYKWLDKDNLSSIIDDQGVYWTELTCSTSTFPQYAYNYIKNWCINIKGLRYLYDIK